MVSEKAAYLICEVFPVIALWNESVVALSIRPLRDTLTPCLYLIITHKFFELSVGRDAKAEIMPCLFNAAWLATIVCKNVPKDVGNDKCLYRDHQ